MGDLAEDTALSRVGSDPGRYRANLSPDWMIWGPNGGYLAVIALRAAGELARVPRPAAFAGHFLSVARFAPVDVEVQVLKAGKRAESLSVSIHQEGRAIFTGLVRTAADGPGLEHDVSELPDVARPGELKSIAELISETDTEADGPPFPFWNNFEVRPVWPERIAEPPRAREPIFREWYRFQPRATFDDPWLEAGRALLMIDTASWIAACQPHPNSAFTAPNLDVTAWFHRSAPESEWLLTDHVCPVAEAGLMGTHARIWSESGKLLATGGAQLLCVPHRSS